MTLLSAWKSWKDAISSSTLRNSSICACIQWPLKWDTWHYMYVQNERNSANHLLRNMLSYGNFEILHFCESQTINRRLYMKTASHLGDIMFACIGLKIDECFPWDTVPKELCYHVGIIYIWDKDADRQELLTEDHFLFIVAIIYHFWRASKILKMANRFWCKKYRHETFEHPCILLIDDIWHLPVSGDFLK